jgi:hypothetical protein
MRVKFSRGEPFLAKAKVFKNGDNFSNLINA